LARPTLSSPRSVFPDNSGDTRLGKGNIAETARAVTLEKPGDVTPNITPRKGNVTLRALLSHALGAAEQDRGTLIALGVGAGYSEQRVINALSRFKQEGRVDSEVGGQKACDLGVGAAQETQKTPPNPDPEVPTAPRGRLCLRGWTSPRVPLLQMSQGSCVRCLHAANRFPI